MNPHSRQPDPTRCSSRRRVRRGGRRELNLSRRPPSCLCRQLSPARVWRESARVEVGADAGPRGARPPAIWGSYDD